MRPLGIPTVKDRIVQGAIKMAIEPIWEKEFLSSSYGFRPGRGAHGAIDKVSRYIEEGYHYVLDADIKGYFDNISHVRLMELVATKIADGRILQLIKAFLEAGIIEEMKEWKPTKGTPQGGVLSPLLANIYLHPLDVLMKENGFRMIRYADDFIITGKRKEMLEDIVLPVVKSFLKIRGLKLSEEKTRSEEHTSELQSH